MEMIEMGTISARGQICIPRNIREHLGLEEGTKIVFAVKDKMLMLKRAENEHFENIFKPLHQAKKNIKEKDVPDLIHKIRRENANRTRH